MRGRKPLPNAIKRLVGDGIHDSGGRLIGNDMQPEAGAPEVPEGLDGEALLEWGRITAELEPTGVLTKADRAALTIHCQTWALMVEAHENLRKTGTIIKLPNGYPGPSPFLKVYQDAARTVAKFLTEFGGTPSARARIPGQVEATESDELELR